jgi:succinate dehydrogenase / fumarate reductase cytochrome b subunit
VPHLFLIEVTLWLAIAFHSILGVYYARTGRPNVKHYAYQDNWRYTLQRISGYLGILFIFYHVATLRWGWDFLIPGTAQWSHHFSASTLAAAMKGSTETITGAGIAVSALYFVGITMLVYHFANGMWTAAITWGLTVSEGAQKRWGWVCTALGFGLMAAAWGAFFGALALDYDDAKAVEVRMIMANPEHVEAVIEKYGEAYWHDLVEKYRGDPMAATPTP